jgi:integrase
MNYHDLRATLQNHFRALRDEAIKDIDLSGGLNASDRDLYQSSLAVAEQANETDSPLSLVSSDDGLLARFIERYALDISQGTDEYFKLERDVKRGYRRFLQDVLAYDKSVASFDLEPQPQQSVKDVSGVLAGLTLSDVIKDYTSEKKAGKNWAVKTESEKLKHLELLTEILGESTDFRSLGALDAQKVKTTLRAYPVNREKNKETRGNRPLSEILDLPGVPKLHTTSVNKYLQSYGDLFNWAKQNGYIEQNYFAGLSIRQNRARAQDNRAAFSLEQIQLVIEAILSNRDGLANKDYQKWGPLIGIYTGARLNEIAQLHLKDIKQVENVWCFDFNDEGDRKSLKNSASRRIVPIHPVLLQLGLLQYVEGLRQTGQQKLFPTFTYDAKNGWGRHLSRHFNNTLLPKLGIKSKELVFHSLRHTVVTMLMQADVDEPVVQAVVGHTRKGVTQQNYFKRGYTVRQLDEAVRKLDFKCQV